MTNPSQPRSVKIGSDERTGWSSDRPRPEGVAARPVDVSGRCRVLKPSDRLRYSPGSLLMIVSGSPAERDAFTERLIEDRSVLLSVDKVRGLLAGRVDEEEMEERATELLDAAVGKRLDAGETVVIPAAGLSFEERDRYIRMAHKLRRPRHLILLDVPRDQVSEEDRNTVNDLRTALDAGALGEEGFQTALRLGGGSMGEVKRIVFAPPPKDD